jgi:thioredoxin 1
MAEQLTDETFAGKTKSGLVVVDFYADWCGPCKLIAPVVEKLSQEMKEVKFYKLDVDANPHVAEQFGVRSIPTILFLKDGHEVDTIMGYMPEPTFRQKVKQTFGL